MPEAESEQNATVNENGPEAVGDAAGSTENEPAPSSLDADRPRGPKIEGGRGAVVVGATVDGLAAAILLAKAGVDVVLVENGLRLAPNEPCAPAPGFAFDLADAPLARLDPNLVKELGLTRRGFSFSDRRLQTVYVLGDGRTCRSDGDFIGIPDLDLRLAEPDPVVEGRHPGAAGDASARDGGTERDGDPADPAPASSGPDGGAGRSPENQDTDNQSMNALLVEDRRTCADFMERLVDAAMSAEELLSDSARAKAKAAAAEDALRLLVAPLNDYLWSAGLHPVFRDILAAEAALETRARPDAPMSAGALALKLMGASLGRKGALGFPKDGVRGLSAAMRRAAQAAGVDIRPVGDVDALLIERDRIEGVSFSDGGQIRAPIVVDASPAGDAFLEHVGRSALDIDVGFRWERRPPSYGVLRACVALRAVDGDEVKVDQRPRYAIAPTATDLIAAYSQSPDDWGGEGGLAAEAIFVNRRIAAAAPPGAAAISLRCAPVPRPPANDDATWRMCAERAIRHTLLCIDPSLPERIVGMEFDWAPLAEPLAIEAANARRASAGGGVIGHFFCGREAQMGVGINGRAGRRAAARAISFAKELRR
ncbi:MAG: hypothetical protein AAFX08_08965 [Pseudomonadota bacterium]